MKKVLSLFLSIVLVLGIFMSVPFTEAPFKITAEASSSGTCGTNVNWSLNNGVLTISGTGEMKNYSFSSSVPWYSSSLSIKEVVINEGVTSIGDSAFEDCTSLTSVTIGDSVTSIGDRAFYNTGYYNDSSNWENGILYIGNHLIKAENSISGSYEIKDGTKTISGGAFEYCTSLTSIAIPNSVTSIGDYTFYDCTSLTSVTIGDSVTSIGDYTFYDCTSLTSVTIPDSVTSIAVDAFASCTSLRSVYITDIDTWSKIDFGSAQANPMYWADTLYLNGEIITDIVLPEGITKIPACAFKGCDISEIAIPDSVTSIGERAFYCCYGLDSITISDNITSIGSEAFDNTGYSYNENNWEDGVLYIGNHLIKAETSISESYEIKDGTKTIGDSAFSYCYSLTAIDIPDSIINIPSYAFYYCSNLTEANIGNGVTVIEEYAFSDCDSLTSVTIGENIKSIGEAAFWGCTGLQAITFSDCDIEIGNDAFWYCENLEKITVNDSILNCGSWSFNGCEKINSVYITNITKWCNSSFGHYSNPLQFTNNFYLNGELVNKIDIPYGVTEIGDGVFDSFGNLTAVTIPSTVTRIGDSAFENCSGLSEITIPNSVVSIGECAFLGCESIEMIDIPDSVMNIGSQAFYGCKGLKTANIGNGIKNAEWYTFGYCDKLEEVVIKEGASIIPDYCFYGCESLKSVNIPDSVTNIGRLALGYFGDVKGGVTPLENFTIYGTIGTEAHNYAKENNFRFIDPNHTHTSSSWITDKAATVNAAGSKHKECTECGAVLETATIAQLKCSKPTLSSVSNTTSGVKVSWGKVSGADRYRVYRKTSSSEWTCLNSKVTSTSYTDKTAKSGTKYYYTVRAENEAGLSSYNTTGLSIKRLSTPKLSKTENTTSGVKITWGKVTGASGYYVYRKTSGSGWKQIGKTTKTYYTDTTTKSGTTYYYTVRAYSGSVKSYYDTDGLKIKHLADPTLKTPTSTKNGISLKWTKTTGAQGYVIYRKTADGSYKKIATVKESTKTSYVDKSAKKGKKYTYKVKAYYSKTYSAYSNAKTIKDKY